MDCSEQVRREFGPDLADFVAAHYAQIAKLLDHYTITLTPDRKVRWEFNLIGRLETPNARQMERLIEAVERLNRPLVGVGV